MQVLFLFVPKREQHLSRPVCLQAQGARPLAQMPAWTLADDDSGLHAMLRSQVRMQHFLLQA
jgi:hypothetical protein